MRLYLVVGDPHKKGEIEIDFKNIKQINYGVSSAHRKTYTVTKNNLIPK